MHIMQRWRGSTFLQQLERGHVSHQSSLYNVIQRLKNSTKAKETSVNAVLEAFEHRGFGPLLLIPALFLLLPTGALPGVPIVCSVILSLITLQILLGRKHPWLPNRLRNMRFRTRKLQNGLDKITPAAKIIDRYTGPRMLWLITPLSQKCIAMVCLLLAISIIPIGLIPFAVDPIAIAVIILALGITVGDGLIIAVGIVTGLASAIAIAAWWL